ncbi:MFS transporter [Parvibaculum sp.]|uniref:MFS transporter n=1 Tax=Parvibaculum sp. TaxID=2024848 RepID=UPI0025E26C41|nr:MFS transporter [Parvibaculum sp.]
MTKPSRSALPAGVWALGLVSLFMDMSSELVHALLPIFLTTTLGASMLSVGLIEGIAEATAAMTKVVSGTLSDWLGRRKRLAVIGYGLAALSKPFFPLADSIATVLTARIADRIGKGIRGAPRDALIADITAPEQRGEAYGLRQSLDTAGAVLGPLIGIALMTLLNDNIRLTFWFAVLPALAAVTILVLFVHEPEPKVDDAPAKSGAPRIRWADVATMGTAYWGIVAIGGVLTLARFSEAFLVLRAETAGLGIAFVPLVLVMMSAVYTLSAYPAGLLADRLDKTRLLALGFVALIAADLVLAHANEPVMLFTGVGLWGLHMGLTQGLLSTLVADSAPKALRGTAFGIFNFVSGIVLLAASLIAGYLWEDYGPASTFYAGAIITMVGLAGLVLLPRRNTAKK